MGERVNIQYSVDIDNLGDEVCRLMCDAYENLNAANEAVATPTNDVLSLQTIREINEVRQALANVDIRLGDAVNIINGYVSYESQTVSQQNLVDRAEQTAIESAPQQVNYDDMPEALDTLKDQLQQFKNGNENTHQG